MEPHPALTAKKKNPVMCPRSGSSSTGVAEHTKLSEIVNTAKSCDFSIVWLWCQSKGEAENLLHLEEPDLRKVKVKKGGWRWKLG